MFLRQQTRLAFGDWLSMVEAYEKNGWVVVKVVHLSEGHTVITARLTQRL